MARIDVPMPQMGESIAEGTVSKWLKQVGDPVKRDEPILEISTDKVDAEIPAPSEGVLVEILVSEGETVEVGTVVAYLDPDAEPGAVKQDAGDAEATAEQAASGAGQDASDESRTEDRPAPDTQEEPPASAAAGEGEADAHPGAEEEAEAAPEPEEEGAARDEERAKGGEETAEHRLRRRSTPVVRKIAEEHDLELSEVKGTGHGGRVTKQDILAHLDQKGEEAPEPSPAQAAPAEAKSEAPSTQGREPGDQTRPSSASAGPRGESAVQPTPSTPSESFGPSELWKTFYSQVQHPEFPVRPNDRVEAMDKIRRLTAEHMVLAKRVAPHVHSFIEIDFTRVDGIRRANKARWADQGVKVSYTAFVAWACSRLLRDYPQINGTVSGNNLIYRANVNVGVAVDLDPGLIVPVIRDADELSLVGVAKKIVDLAERARSRRLNPDEIQGVTFSITNPGVLGTMVGMPIIPKGTAAILGTGAIEKRVVVVEDPDSGTDSIAIRKRTLFSLGYDHRIVDGADAARFLAQLKGLLEAFPEDA